MSALEPSGRGPGDFRIKDDVEVGVGQPPDIVRRGVHRGRDIDVDAEALTEQARDLDEIVTVPET